MCRKPVEVAFDPVGRGVTAWAGDTVLDAALDNGLDLPHECGGNCSCTTCHVIVEEGAECLSALEEPEIERLATDPRRVPASRLACQALLLGGPVRVRVLGPEGGMREVPPDG